MVSLQEMLAARDARAARQRAESAERSRLLQGKSSVVHAVGDVDLTKRAMAKIVVQFIEQTYKDLHGEAKLNAALAALSELLMQKGIKATDYEMRILIEAAVGEFNEAFKKE